jgi:hypothetical protein
LQILLLALGGLYAGDYICARYGIPKDRQILGSMHVQTLYAVRQKSGRIEYLMGDTAIEPCVHSLFPHMGYVPCWYLSRHTTKRIELGRIDQTVPREIPEAAFAPHRHILTMAVETPTWGMDETRASPI